MFNFERSVNHIEKTKSNIYGIFITFLAIVFLRTFLESFSSFSLGGNLVSLSGFFHSSIWFFAIFLFVIIILKIFTLGKINEILNIVTFAFPLILIVPIIDYIFKSNNIFYVSPGGASLIQNLSTFFSYHSGFSLGMAIEISLLLILLSSYIILKTNKIYLGILGATLCYCFGGVMGSLPSILNLGKGQDTFFQLMFFIVTLSFIQINALFILISKKRYIYFLKNMRIERILHYTLMLIIGFVIGILIFETEFLSISSFLKLISLIISGVLAWIFSIIVNDITDFKIDLISNNKRPFVNKILNLDQYKLIGCISLIFSLMFSYIVGEKFLLGFLIIILLSLVYSIYPLRLKRFLIISRLPLALVAAILILLGFMLTSQDGAISIFPKKILFGAIIALLFSTNFIDIKDTAGDKKEGIKTITTKFGLRDGKIIISLFMGISYISLPIIFNIYTLIIPSIIISFINHVYLTKTKYEERLIFGLYFFYILLLSIYILLNKSIILS